MQLESLYKPRARKIVLTSVIVTLLVITGMDGVSGLLKLHCMIAVRHVFDHLNLQLILLAFTRFHFNQRNIPSAKELTRCVPRLVDELQESGELVWYEDRQVFISPNIPLNKG